MNTIFKKQSAAAVVIFLVLALLFKMVIDTNGPIKLNAAQKSTVNNIERNFEQHAGEALFKDIFPQDNWNVAWADACKGSAMHESHWLQQAIARLRNIKGSRERRKELQARLVAVQPLIRDEMGVFEAEIDLTDLVDHAREAIGGRSLIRALGEFAQLCRSPDPIALRERARKDAEGSPLASLFSATILDDEGKVVARSPDAGDLGATDDAALQRLVLQHESQRRGISVTGLIDPARQVIHAEHPIEERDLLPLMVMSPFVPPGREFIFARAFARFFGGDFMSAIHLLFPQGASPN